ncbi:MAG: hypothetical protein II622_03190 [Thermoguttaceae bacterium]|nr:hypothetical protein [Thermoguttaceae bacterium]
MGNLFFIKSLRPRGASCVSAYQIHANKFFAFFVSVFLIKSVSTGSPCLAAAARAEARLKFCPAEQAVKIDNLLVVY